MSSDEVVRLARERRRELIQASAVTAAKRIQAKIPLRYHRPDIVAILLEEFSKLEQG